MKGYLKLTTIETNDVDISGLRCECKLSDVSILDKMHILHAVTEALEMNQAEVHLFRKLNDMGILDANIDHCSARPTEQVKKEAIKAAEREGIKAVAFDSLEEFLDHILGGDKE